MGAEMCIRDSLAQRMLKAAAKTNLEAGAIDKLTQRLLLALDQILGDEAQEQGAPDQPKL